MTGGRLTSLQASLEMSVRSAEFGEQLRGWLVTVLTQTPPQLQAVKLHCESAKIYDIFACLITTSWLSRSSPEAAGELLTLSCSLHAAAGELRNNQDIVIRPANMS